jgi:glutamate racemase
VKILVFDSGVGGLSVAREIRHVLPAARIDYVADDAGFPYGGREPEPLAERVVSLLGEYIARLTPDCVVVACNTASTLVLPPLRQRHGMLIVGTVPAIKPAAERTRSGQISVLATAGTIKRDYTRALIDSFAGHCRVNLVGSVHLASLAERFMRGEPVEDGAILAEIAPAFVEEKDGPRTDMVVLACTHYPFLLEQFRQLAPWPVEWIDPAPAIARRVVSVVPPGAAAGGGRAWLTSGAGWPASLQPLLASIGVVPAAAMSG